MLNKYRAQAVSRDVIAKASTCETNDRLFSEAYDRAAAVREMAQKYNRKTYRKQKRKSEAASLQEVKIKSRDPVSTVMFVVSCVILCVALLGSMRTMSSLYAVKRENNALVDQKAELSKQKTELEAKLNAKNSSIAVWEYATNNLRMVPSANLKSYYMPFRAETTRRAS